MGKDIAKATERRTDTQTGTLTVIEAQHGDRRDTPAHTKKSRNDSKNIRL